MKVSLIVAIDLDRGIGRNNDLMWHLPDDMKFFKDTTQDQIVIMGRKNYESIPEKYRPLPNRENVVLTRNKNFSAPDCKVFYSLDEALENYTSESERTIFIIGGGEIYRQSLEQNAVDEMYITHINNRFGADTFFPEFDLKNWRVEILSEHKVDEKHNSSFSILRYTKK